MPRSRPLLLLLGALLGAGIVLAGTWVLSFDGRKQIDLASWADPPKDGFTGDMMPGARWATTELCDEELPCIQAVTSDSVTMYRFAEREHAMTAARWFAGEGYLSGWIVVRFEPGALTADERRSFVGALDCINVGITEDGVEC